MQDGTVSIPQVTKALVWKQLLKLVSQGEFDNVSFSECGRPMELAVKTIVLLITFRFRGTRHTALSSRE